MARVLFTSMAAAEKAIREAGDSMNRLSAEMHKVCGDRRNRKFLGFGALKTKPLQEMVRMEQQFQAIKDSLQFTDEEWRQFRRRVEPAPVPVVAETASAISAMRPLRFRPRT
jgi:hypothetical protein